MTTATLAPPDPTTVEVDPVHTAALDALTTITDRVRYACEHGPGPRTDAVRQWLAAYGIETRRPYVSTLVNGYRANQGMSDTGEVPALTDDALTDLDPDPEPAEPDPVEVVATDEQPEPEPMPRHDTDPVPVATPASAPEPDPPATLTEPDPVPASVATPEPAPEPTSSPVATTPPPDVHRAPKPGAVVALTLSSAITAAAILVTVRTPLSVVQALPGSMILAGGFVVVAVLLMLTWSAGSVIGSLVAGRTGRDLLLDVASWTVAGIAGFLAAYGQVKFGEWAGMTGFTRFLVPGMLEPSVVVLLLLANRRVRRRLAGLAAKPIGKILALAALLGAFAVYTNVAHTGDKLGLVFGAATVVGLILWWVKLQDDAAPDTWDDAPQSKRLSRRTSKYRLLRWIILFPQTRRAWLISLDHSISDAEAGLDLARRWARAYDANRAADVPRRIARRIASQHIDEYLNPGR
ncbi:hypothetical protein GCM10010435_65940 [Winogradskya consettensis]|uniref:Uncharacterized protein n=1 Tax=Winogradskya consettensis TaxID=113560 RepID=A0A919T590_9ACTN|nr:hypothetical protein [Actinoplanes consettensis]GIM84785.1 hypothetical protein Aco04nite_93140 [Actinoplanes consettensis]